jgi:lincosamide nucleotidyltransferase A/C/D/E
MVRAEDAVQICQSLTANGFRTWLIGGWGIDALLAIETRPHKDLDILILVDDVDPMRRLLAQAGFSLKELWSENAAAFDFGGTEVPTAFVLHDANDCEIDAHALRLDAAGNGIPAWADDEGLIFTSPDLSGRGTIRGVAVQCVSPGMQVRCHAGYELPEYQRQDLRRLREKYDAAPRVQSH